jgi:hypothetical protein
MTIFTKSMYRLSHWEEVVGVLHRLDEDASFVTVGLYNVFLPSELIISLKQYIGKRIAILRTDNQAKPYLWRLLD